MNMCRGEMEVILVERCWKLSCRQEVKKNEKRRHMDVVKEDRKSAGVSEEDA